MISKQDNYDKEKSTNHINNNTNAPKSELSNQEFREAFYKGDPETINTIYQQNVDLMYNYGRQLYNDADLVKDCIQEVFLRLIKSRNTTTSITSVRAYLLKSLKREILRNKERSNKYNLKDSFKEDKSFGIALSDEMKPIEVHFTDKKKLLLKSALNNLPKKQREAILLYYYEGFTYEEISQIMEVKLVKSARKLIYKAIASIKSSIRKDIIDLMFPFLIFALTKIFL